MPFVRYARDKRGYETLYVMHVFDDEGRGRPRVLYACRTVPYARVGRAPLDESVQRRIEAAYPALAFDWPRLLRDAAASAPRPEKPDTRHEPRKARGRKSANAQVKPVKPVKPVEQVKPVEPAEPVKPVKHVEPAQAPAAPAAPAIPVSPAAAAPPASLALPKLFVDKSWPAVEALGEMRTLVLRGRFIEIANRILSRVEDPAEQRRLWDEAARLNPEGWRTAEQARDAVAGFDAAYEAIANRIRQQPAV